MQLVPVGNAQHPTEKLPSDAVEKVCFSRQCQVLNDVAANLSAPSTDNANP